MNTNRFFAAIGFGLVAFFFARAIGVPVWRSGWDLSVIGDATDIGATTASSVWLALRSFGRLNP